MQRGIRGDGTICDFRSEEEEDMGKADENQGVVANLRIELVKFPLFFSLVIVMKDDMENQRSV